MALGHTKKAMQVAYTATAARGAAAAAGNGAVAALSSSQLGDLGAKLINAQFSQSQESAADDYSFDLLTKNKATRAAWSRRSRSWPGSMAASRACSRRSRARMIAPSTWKTASARARKPSSG